MTDRSHAPQCSGRRSPPNRWVQVQAEKMIGQHGFLGVPRETFQEGGSAHFQRLLAHGLGPDSKVLDIGCGVLRIGSWLIRFLEPGGYAGIEPARDRVELGCRYLLSPELLAEKRPRFDHNAVFDSSGFEDQFDFFLACSIWTHCGKAQIATQLEGFARHTGPSGVFLASYLPATDPEEDYQGDHWVGTSHESTIPGIVRHSLDWIRSACVHHQLRVTELPGIDCDSQYWLRVDKS